MLYPPKAHPQSFVPSRADYDALYAASVADPGAFWWEQARALSWFHPPDSMMEVDFSEGDIAWFRGGKLNACYNAVDRHAQQRPDDVAMIWVGNDPGVVQKITYRELRKQVCRFANLLKAQGVHKGDRICIYMPMIPELATAVLACARIGAIHSVVFGGFSAESLRDRILDAGCRLVITANEGLRGPKPIALKSLVDQAIEGLELVERVLVARRTPTATAMKAGRDLWLDEQLPLHRPSCPVEWMDAEDPLFILYTSGSTGKPKGVLHTTGGYLCYAATTFRWAFDARPGDIHFCTADIGWITGHSYILYGPLTSGVTTVIFEGVPTWPDAGRLWEICDQLQVNILYTAPTALRTLMGAGDSFVQKHRRDSIRILGTVGEPINPEVWRWYHDVVGEGRCAVVDTWWQTETGGILIAPLPGAVAAKPGSATLPFPGVKPLLLDDEGRILEGNGVRGNLVLAGSWPGQARTVWGDHKRFVETYFSRFPGYYFTGDGCERDADGYYWITGRVDDVLNVSGHRIGTAEVESALVSHSWVVEAAVVGYPHPIKGTGIRAYVQLRGEPESIAELVGALKEHVRHVIGPIATPDQIRIVPGLPKTRSGKIMRRILRKIAEGQREDLGDLSTLADPTVVEAILAGEG